MLFSSFGFVYLFLPLVVVVNYGLRFRAHARKLALIAASLVFYAWGNPWNLAVLLASLSVNYALAAAMARAVGEPEKRRVLVLGLVGNIATLCVYKYTAFALSNIGEMTGVALPVVRLGLPLGISFFTLQQVMYQMDCYEGLSKRHSLVDHAAFVTFFPYVSAGPIVRSREVMPALIAESPAIRADSVAPALLLFAVGLFKKAVFAQTFARWADPVFDGKTQLSVFEALAGSGAYCLQLYYDFSGYSDMAVGAAVLLGVKLPFNFNSPYQSKNVIEFWKRWHISLSRFITTYLYTPLVRLRPRVTLVWALGATFVSMVIAGLWHGASWTFVVFGALHGLGLVTNQLWKKAKIRLPGWLAVALTFAFVDVAFVFFRAPTLAEASRVLSAMVGAQGPLFGSASWGAIRTLEKVPLWAVTPFGVAVVFSSTNSNALFERFRPSARAVWQTVLLAVMALLFLNSAPVKDFVYFDF